MKRAVRLILIAAVGFAAAQLVAQDERPAAPAGPETPLRHDDRVITRIEGGPAADDAGAARGQRNWPQAPPDARFTDVGWFAPIAASDPSPALPDEVTRAFVIPIREPIDAGMAKTIQQKIIQARKGDAQLVIFDIDTPGGEVEAMDRIVAAIEQDLRNVYTVAWVNQSAFSAGAVIALATDEIVMGRRAKIGDAAPVFIGPGGAIDVPADVRAKAISAGVATVKGLARRQGYDVALAAGMVDPDMAVWLIRNRQTGQLNIVDAREWRGRVANVPADPEAGPDAGGAANQDAQWEFVRLINAEGQLVTLEPTEARLYGLSRRSADSMAEMQPLYDITTEPVVLGDSWSDRAAEFLIDPVVTSLLVMIGLMAFYAELHTPGFGFAGIIAVLCVVLLLSGRYLLGLANVWEIAMLVAGMALIMLEVFVVPGFGITGISGIALLVASLVAIAIPNDIDELPIPRTDLAWRYFESGMLAMTLGVVGGLIAAALLSRVLPKTTLGRKVFLAPAEVFTGPPAAENDPARSLRAGDVGLVHNACRPVGKAMFGSALLDVVCEGTMASRGDRVQVLRVEGNTIVVERMA
jgi:membrane-bound serine protease (ClpP class)